MRKFIKIILRLGFRGAKTYFLLGTLLSSAYIIFNSAVPYLIQKWINISVNSAEKTTILRFGVLFALAITAAIIMDYVGAWILILLREKLRLSMRKNLLREIISSDIALHAEKESGYYTQVLMNDVEKSCGVVVSFVYMVLPAVIGLPSAIIFASLISRVFTVAGVIGFLFLAALVYLSSKKLRNLSEERQEAYAQLGEKINELINASVMIRMFNALNPVLLRKDQYFKELKDSSVKKNSFGYLIQVISELVQNIIQIIAVLFALLSAKSTPLTGASIMAGVVYLSRIWQPLVLIGEINEEIQAAVGSVNRINNLILRKGNTGDKKHFLLNSVSKIECRDVALLYGKTTIAKGINFSIRKGECLGITGESGAGKTTLAKSIIGLHSNFSGEILINGISVREIANIHDFVGYLPQFVPVLTDSFQFNISLSETYDKEKLLFAIKYAGLEKFLEGLPDGIDTIISEKTISGGERKRIGIARLLYRNFSALIFDEPFSGVDKDTARKIYEEVIKIAQLKGKILLIISHNENYLLHCNKKIHIKSYERNP